MFLCPAGVFKAWVLVGAQMYAVPLRVPRTLYVNSSLAPDDPESPARTLGGLRMSRTLPFGREPAHIYQARRLAFPASQMHAWCPTHLLHASHAAFPDGT